ncbi:Head-to-tail connector protein, podovirus-type like protein, partial [Aduncisulcus paluster]
AEEVKIRDQRNMRILAPVIIRLLVEYKSRVIERSFFILLRGGYFDQLPPGLEGQEFEIEHISSVLKADKYNDIEAAWSLIMRAFEVAKMGKPEVLDNFDFDAIIKA